MSKSSNTKQHLIDPADHLDNLEVRVTSLEEFRERIQDIEKEVLLTLRVIGKVFRGVGKLLKWNLFLGVAAAIAHFAGLF